MNEPIQAYLVCGGRYHDFDFARLELLKLLAEREAIRTRVAADYRDREALAASDFLLTYTCDVRPSLDEQRALHAFVASGKRWFALHGTNALLDFVSEGVLCPRSHPLWMETLGSQFLAHPPIQRFRVEVSDRRHPLVAGIRDFEIEDELYLSAYHGERVNLLETRFRGAAPGFVESDWPEDRRHAVMYLHPVERGAVLYLTLGHCRGRWDMRPFIPDYPRVERCAWKEPVYYELLRRGIVWAAAH